MDTDPQQQQEPSFDWSRLFVRKDRPLPKRGCSWAFYIFLALLTLALVIMYIQYSKER